MKDFTFKVMREKAPIFSMTDTGHPRASWITKLYEQMGYDNVELKQLPWIWDD